MSSPRNVVRPVLVIDDQTSIHDDYRKILTPSAGAASSASLASAKAALFGAEGATRTAARAADAAAPRFRLLTATQGEDGVRVATDARNADSPVMVAFVDMRMPPGWDGATTIEHLWKHDPRMQVVICSAYSDESLDEIARRLGHSDRLLILKKPFETVEVLQLATALSEKWLAERDAEARIDELQIVVRERTAEIERTMLHDRLTGLPNRMLIQSRIDACIERQKRNPAHRFALLYIDFDRFKIINDSLGHEVGDDLLVAVATRLRDSLRATDAVTRISTASRIGGDEFLLLLEELQHDRDAAAVAERLLAVLSEPYEIGQNVLQLTASIGIATSEQPYECPAEMVRDADTAMYRAKAAGRARYSMFDSDMHAQVMMRLSLEQGLREAVRNETIDVFYQPIVSLEHATIAGFEALLRWTHPQHGPIAASELISIAEETGLIQPLSLVVLRRACRQLRAWLDLVPRPQKLLMSVNLSRRQLIDPLLVQKIAAIIKDADLEPGHLILEVTESAAFDSDDAERTLRMLRELGVWLHLDDFGTGYSSLSCLYKLPLTGLKIDREFMRGVCNHHDRQIVLESIVRIARALELQVIAEGVEDTEQFSLLRGLNVDHAQGYLFGKPVSAEDTLRLVGQPVRFEELGAEHAYA